MECKAYSKLVSSELRTHPRYEVPGIQYGTEAVRDSGAAENTSVKRDTVMEVSPAQQLE